MLTACGRLAGSILTTGPDHHELPIEPTRGRRRDEVEVESLVDHAAVAESRVRDGGLVGRVDETPAGPPEVVDVDAARKAMDVGVAAALRCVQLSAAGQHQVGPVEQATFLRDESLGRSLEAGEVVHAVEDGQRTRQMLGPAEGHRGVVPEDRILDVREADEVVDQPAERLLRVIALGARQPRCHDRDAFALRQVEPGRSALIERRLFDEEDPTVTGGARHQMVRPLVHKIPAKVRKAQKVTRQR